MRAVKIVDAICIALFLFMGIYIFALSDGMQDQLMPVFTVINPYQTGAWIMGIGFLVTCLRGQGRSGLILGIIMLICYLVTAFVSLFGLMVVTNGTDLLWYLHALKVLGIVLVANLASFMLPYVLLYESESWYGTFQQILEAGPNYIVGGVFLLLTIVAEMPIVYGTFKNKVQNKKFLLWTIIISNTVTTAGVAIVERMITEGAWA